MVANFADVMSTNEVVACLSRTMSEAAEMIKVTCAPHNTCRSKPRPHQRMLTKVTSRNHDCAETNPCPLPRRAYADDRKRTFRLC
jgi:hypothetical protein